MNSEELEFEVTETPSSADLDFLTQGINSESLDQGSAYPFAIFIRDKEDQIIAGCNGSLIFGSIYTDRLWVKPNLRGQGIAKKLMEFVHAYGKKQGCTLATVTTMDFQVPGFYQKLGYEIDFSRTGYNKGASCIFILKHYETCIPSGQGCQPS